MYLPHIINFIKKLISTNISYLLHFIIYIHPYMTSNNPLGLPSHDDIIELVKIESIMRYSDEYINECNRVANEPNGWLRITGEMQEQIARDYGFTDVAVSIAVNMLRTAQYRYPDNEHVQNLVYVKNNKANLGRFNNGDTIDNVNLYDIDGIHNIELNNLLQKDKINIIFAASHT